MYSYRSTLINIQNLAEENCPNFKEKELELLDDLCKIRESKGILSKEYLLAREWIEVFFYKQVIALWKKYKYRHLSLPYEIDDYVNSWLIGLYKWFEKYNPKRNTTFLTSWKRRITNELDKLVSKGYWLNKGFYFKLLKVKSLCNEWYSKKELLKIIKDVFESTSKSWLDRLYIHILPYLEWFSNISLDYTYEHENWISTFEKVLAINPIQELIEIDNKQRIVSKILSILESFSKYDSKITNILKMRLNYLSKSEIRKIAKVSHKEIPIIKDSRDTYSLQQVWDLFWLHKERIRQLEKKFLDKLKESKEVQKLKELYYS